MRLPSETNLVTDVMGVLYAECGVATASHLVREAVGRVQSLPEPEVAKAVGPCSPSSDADHALWHELMRGFAAAKPEAFDAHGSGGAPLLYQLDGAPRGDALAYLYVRDRHPDQLACYRGDRAGRERELMRRARAGLTEAVDDNWKMWHRSSPDFEREPEVYIVRRTCPLLHAYITDFQRFDALSLAPHEAVRSVVLIPEDSLRERRRGGPEAVAALLLHEGVHGALADSARAQPDAYNPALTGLVDEGVAEVLSLAAVHLLAPAEPDWEGFRAGARRWRRGLGLLSLLPGLQASDLGRVAQLGVTNLCHGDAEVSSMLLRELANVRERPLELDETDFHDSFVRRLSDPETFLAVRWGDGVRTHHEGLQQLSRTEAT
jgi:hypothetical protein